MQHTHLQEIINAELAEAAAICRAVLSEPEMAGLASRLPEAPPDAGGWFQLLSNYPGANEIIAIQRMKDVVNPDGATGFPSVERYAVLQVLTVALPRVKDLALAVPVKRKFAKLAVQAARPNGQWRQNFEAGRVPFIQQMAELATLRQFPAGELIFNFNKRISYVWLLRFPPRAVPGFLLEIPFGLKGAGPMVCPHVNLWRPNPLFVRKVEVERSWWRIAKTLEHRPDVKFLLGDSWLYSADLSQFAPHLAWWRANYEDAGAYIVSMEPAQENAGFKEASQTRAQLYQAGAFNPRRTLVFWPRAEMLAWAARRMDLADEGECAPLLPARSRSFHIPSPQPARAAKHNSPLHLWNGLGLLSRRPRVYALFVLILPALIVAAAASTIAWWAAMPGFAAAFIAAWLFQYYAFQ